MSSTNKLTNAVIDYILRLPSSFAWRQNTLPVPVGNNGLKSAPKRGVSDVLAIINGTFYAIEIKTGKDRIRPEQADFLRSVTKAGGVSIIASKLDDVVKIVGHSVTSKSND